MSDCNTKGDVQTQNNDSEIPMAFFPELKENHKSHGKQNGWIVRQS